MTEIATIDWFGRWGHLFSLKTLLYLYYWDCFVLDFGDLDPIFKVNMLLRL